MQCRAKNNRLTDSPHVIGYCQSQGMTPSDGRVQPPERKHKQTHAMKLLEKPQIQDHLETLADKHSLCFILNCLAQISFEKSDHVQATWQDRALAKQWEKIAVSLEAIADKNDNL